MNNKLKQQWLEFLEGHWQKEMPTHPGTYVVAEGKFTWDFPVAVVYKKFVVTYIDDTKIRLDRSENEFNAVLPQYIDRVDYWWSVPIPDMPILPGEKLAEEEEEMFNKEGEKDEHLQSNNLQTTNSSKTPKCR